MFNGIRNLWRRSNRTETAPPAEPVEPTQVSIGTQTRSRSCSSASAAPDRNLGSGLAAGSVVANTDDEPMVQLDKVVEKVTLEFPKTRKTYGNAVQIRTNVTRAYTYTLFCSVSRLPPVPAGARNEVTDCSPGWNFANTVEVFADETNHAFSTIYRAWVDIQAIRDDLERYRRTSSPHRDMAPKSYVDTIERRCNEVTEKRMQYHEWSKILNPRILLLQSGLSKVGVDWYPSDPIP